MKSFSLRRKSPNPLTIPPSSETEANNISRMTSLKRGDEKRIMLMNMVKEGLTFVLFYYILITGNFLLSKYCFTQYVVLRCITIYCPHNEFKGGKISS